MPPELEPTHKSNSLIKILGGVALAVAIVASGPYVYLRYFVDSAPVVPSALMQENIQVRVTQEEIMKNYTIPTSSKPIVINQKTPKNYAVPSRTPPVKIDQATLDSFSVPK